MNGIKRPPPHDVCARLVCTQCKEYLSCDPVKVLPNNAVLCGRCSRNGAHYLQAVRSIAFEDVANYFLYPCKYDKCNRLLERLDILQHEIKCVHDQSGCCLCWRQCLDDQPPPTPPQGIYTVPADDKTHELITCAHCHGYLSAAPIFIRANGTYVCYRCGPDLQAPPVMRDGPLETILECFLIKCSYRMNGCEERLQFGEEMILHEAVCDFNPQRQLAQQRLSYRQQQQSHVEAGSNGKVKGVISTISSGHIYATITPNHFYNQYGQHLDDAMLRQLQVSQAGAPMEEASTQLPGVHGHSKQGSIDRSTRSSISVGEHRWSMYTGGTDEDGRMPPPPDEDTRKYLPKLQVKGITRNESILYNNVVTEMKFKQKNKHPSGTD